MLCRMWQARLVARKSRLALALTVRLVLALALLVGAESEAFMGTVVNNVTIGSLTICAWVLAFILDGCFNPPVGEDVRQDYADIRAAFDIPGCNIPVYAESGYQHSNHDVQELCTSEDIACHRAGPGGEWIVLSYDHPMFTDRDLAVHEYTHCFYGSGHSNEWQSRCQHVAHLLRLNWKVCAP